MGTDCSAFLAADGGSSAVSLVITATHTHTHTDPVQVLFGRTHTIPIHVTGMLPALSNMYATSSADTDGWQRTSVVLLFRFE